MTMIVISCWFSSNPSNTDPSPRDDVLVQVNNLPNIHPHLYPRHLLPLTAIQPSMFVPSLIYSTSTRKLLTEQQKQLAQEGFNREQNIAKFSGLQEHHSPFDIQVAYIKGPHSYAMEHPAPRALNNFPRVQIYLKIWLKLHG